MEKKEVKKADVEFYGKGLLDNSESYLIQDLIDSIVQEEYGLNDEDIRINLTKEKVEPIINKIISQVNESGFSNYGIHSLFHLILFLGIPISDELIEYGINSLNSDEWQKEDYERMYIIEYAIKKIKAYKESGYQPVDISFTFEGSHGYLKDRDKSIKSGEPLKHDNINFEILDYLSEKIDSEYMILNNGINYLLLYPKMTDEVFYKMQRNYFGYQLIKFD